VTGSVPAEALFELAFCHLRLGHEAAFRKAMKQGGSESHGVDSATDALALVYMADYHLSQGKIALAAGEAERAVRIGQSHRSPKVNAIVTLAAARLRQGRAKEALTLAQSVGGPYAHAYAASAYRMLGRRADAYRVLREAAEDADHGMADFDENQSEFQFTSFANFFVQLVDMLVEDRRFTDALDAAERAKGRALLRALRGGRAMADTMMTDEERAHEREVERRVTALNSQAGPLTAARRAELVRARTELEEYRTILYAKYPRLKAQKTTPAAIDGAQMAELLRDRSAGFLEFVIGEHRMHAFLVRRSGRGVTIDCRTTRIERARMEKKVVGYVGAVAAHDLLYAAPSRQLYQLLLAPFQSQLRGVKTLCIIPDGTLWQLPFESLLQPDGRFFVQRMAVLYAPSITVYREMTLRERAERAPGQFLAFADPPIPPRVTSSVTATKLRDGEYMPLPEAAREVEAIAALFANRSAKVYVGADALESRAKAESPRYAVIHFATHGVLDDDDPMFSHLLLAARPGDASEDGLLETWEMMRLDLHASLAVLSACETARGAIHDGEGLIGMAWALSVAGTSSTIVTQWKIASSTTADLMVDFYRQWLHSPKMPFSKAEALRRARLHVLSAPAHRHPFYWSAFVLIGSGS
jgi:CHAT domain-containing protein